NERLFAEYDEVPNIDQPFSEFTDVTEVVDHWSRMVERDTEFRVVMLEYLLHAMRNPEARKRALEFRAAYREQLTDYIAQRTPDADEVPISSADLAGMFGIMSDGFAQEALLDPDATRLYGITLDLIVRGIRSLSDSESV